MKWFKDYELEELNKNKVGKFGRFLCAIGWHKRDELYCVRCGNRAYTLM